MADFERVEWILGSSKLGSVRRSVVHYRIVGRTTTLCGREVRGREPKTPRLDRPPCEQCSKRIRREHSLKQSQCMAIRRDGERCSARNATQFLDDGRVRVCGMHMAAYREARQVRGREAALYRIENGKWPDA